MPKPSFSGLRVLVLESRRGNEIASLIANYGGTPVLAPAMREVPIGANDDAIAFAGGLQRGEFDTVILLTGVGTRILLDAAESVCPCEEFIAALRRTRVVARGPKPVAVLRELGLTPDVTAPEPNTWRELLQALDTAAGPEGLRDKHVAVQEYGVTTPELLAGLRERGARVTQVPVYRWALPENTGPLLSAIAALGKGEIDIVLFTTGIQVSHLFQVAVQAGQEEMLRHGLGRAVIASIGPVTSEELRRHGLTVDLEPSHPRMGLLVKETAERSAELLGRRRQGGTAAERTKQP